MCLTIPAKIIKINKNKAVIQRGKNQQEIDISLLSSLKKGDYILSQNGIAIKKITENQAQEINKLLKLKI